MFRRTGQIIHRHKASRTEILNTTTTKISFNPVKEAFRDVSAWKLLISSRRIFWRIYRLQGVKSFRVFPIMLMIVKAVRGFSKFHQKEYEQIATAKITGSELAESELTADENAHYRELGRWLCKRLHDLGPTFIKIGQTLSTRADLMPLPAMLELATLQENVEPFSTQVAITAIEEELGGKIEELYGSFNPVPIAAASLSQAFKAVLKDGRDVVVKVQRPNLPEIIANDVQVLEAIAEEVMHYPSLCRHTDWPGVVKEFSRTIVEEIDYIQEGRNADRFRQNFRNFDMVYIPRIVWRLTGRQVLTIEYVGGSRITDVEALEAQGIDRESITKTGTNFYLRQLLEDGFFHADPHPGNLRVMADGRVGIFDFGMVGQVSPELKQGLVSAFLHVIKHEYRPLVDDFIAMGFLPENVDREALFLELSPILDKRFAQGMNKLRFRQVLFDFSDVCWRYPFRLPTEFTYIMRALLTLEGVALIINPKYNFLETTLPFAHRILLKNNAKLGKTLIKEVFVDGRFNRQAAMDLFKAATRLVSMV
jgi:predicted unusual protein kinase regulating ubiquinone biosynthesis (AarF/ABC1/UbiB family)